MTAGVPLSHYPSHRAGVELHCRACPGRRLLDLEVVLAELGEG